MTRLGAFRGSHGYPRAMRLLAGASIIALGTTCFAMHTPTGMRTAEAQFNGERQAIQEQIAEHALAMIAQYLTTTAQGV